MKNDYDSNCVACNDNLSGEWSSVLRVATKPKGFRNRWFKVGLICDNCVAKYYKLGLPN